MIENLGTDDAPTCPHQFQDAGTGHQVRSPRRRRPGDRYDHPRIILGGVEELHRADHRVGAQRRSLCQRATAGEMAVAWHRARTAQRVVQHEPSTEVEPLPAASAQRPHKRHRRDEVGSQPGEQQLALAKRLANEPDIAHLQVSQTAVNELAGLTRRARSKVRRLDQSHLQSSRRGIERRSGTGDAAADDEDVEFAGGDGVQRIAPGDWVQEALGPDRAGAQRGSSAAIPGPCRTTVNSKASAR